MAAAVGKLEVPHKRILAFLLRWTHDNFATEGGMLSDGPWAPFAQGGRVNPKTGDVDTSAKLLQDTRTMYLHFDIARNSNNKALRSRVVFGNDIPYAETHEEGDGWVPQRRMLPRESEVLDDIVSIYDGYIKEVTK